jgi:F-type H+-transporting ATPase subunit delta
VSATKISHAVTSRYALALIELAQESNKVEKVEKDLSDLSAMITGSPDLALAISSPSLSRDKQAAAVSALADKAKFDALTKNFLGVLVNNRRLGAVQAIIEAVKAELSKRRGEVAVDVQTAQPMTATQMEALQRAISKSLGREVAMKARVEPGILGGLIVTVGSQMVDDSVLRKLQRLKAAMGRQSNQNFNDTMKEVK